MKSLIITLMFITLIFSTGNGQSELIHEIKYEGAEHLDEEYLAEYISSTEGGFFKWENIEADVQRLKRLNAVAHAFVTVDSSSSQRNLIFHLEKRGATLPIVGFGGVEGNLWFNLGVSDYNFQGKNQIFETYYLNNSGRHNGKIFFQNNRIKGSKWGYGLSALRQATEEPVFFTDNTIAYSYTNHAIGLSSLYWIDDETFLEGGLTFFQEDYAKLETGDIVTPGPDQLSLKKSLLKIGIRRNKLRYDYFYREGSDWLLYLQNVHTFTSPTPFFSITYEFRKFYRPFTKGNIAFRLKSAIATNNNSPFAPFVLDSYFNIRGVGNRVDRGTAQLIANLEYRHTLHHKSAWAFQVVGFVDAGSWRNPGGRLSDLWRFNTVRLFYGLGVRAIYNKHLETTLRIDYGIDAIDKRQRGLVIGIGQFF